MNAPGGGEAVAVGAPASVDTVAAQVRRFLRRYPTLVAMPALLIAFMAVTVIVHPSFGSFDIQSLAMGALPLAFAAAAQTVVVVAGGIDLSIGSVMAVSNVLAAATMEKASFGEFLLLAVLIIVAGAAQGAINGLIVVFSRIPDVVVTLTTGFIWGGVALLIMEKPGGGAPADFVNIGAGTFLVDWLPGALVMLVVAVAIIWIPVRRSRLGLLLYATGSDRIAAFRSGVNVEKARFASYVIGGLFSAVGGLGLTMTTGIGAPLAGVLYTLSGLAAIVIGGVSLAGGRGGMIGPMIAAYVLTLIPTDLIFMDIDPNYGQVIQGSLIVVVVMVGGLVTVLRKRQ